MPLGAHGHMEAKRRRLSRDSGVNPVIDPEGYRRLVADAEQRFEAQLADERR